MKVKVNFSELEKKIWSITKKVFSIIFKILFIYSLAIAIAFSLNCLWFNNQYYDSLVYPISVLYIIIYLLFKNGIKKFLMEF